MKTICSTFVRKYHDVFLFFKTLMIAFIATSTRNVIFYNSILSYRALILSYRACILSYRL